jgi:ubiquinone/menaquinone biosynthesis C-methylase UbiE
MTYTKEEVRQANRALHAALADVYKQTEPHYKPENVRRVRGILADLQERTKGGSLLDLGCGAGFVIDIAKGIFPTIRGVDICEQMLSQIDTSTHGKCDLEVRIATTENTPFDDNTFDVCTAYAVLHHLDALGPTFREAFRVLRPGGVLYTDLDPNARFWQALKQLPANGKYSAIVRREIDAVLHKDQQLCDEFGIPPKLLHAAEHLKHDAGGFAEEELREALHRAGFRKIEVRYEWFLGEAHVTHSQSEEVLLALRGYLQSLLPLSRHVFKYLLIFAEK